MLTGGAEQAEAWAAGKAGVSTECGGTGKMAAGRRDSYMGRHPPGGSSCQQLDLLQSEYVPLSPAAPRLYRALRGTPGGYIIASLLLRKLPSLWHGCCG